MKFTSEMVFRGHPDKVCDQIAGAILDALLYNDVNSKAGIEVLGAKKKLHITGEVTTKATVDTTCLQRGDFNYGKEKEG